MQTEEKTRSYGLSQVDEVRSRMDATYSEAMQALDESEGDLLRALAIIEENRKAAASEETDLVERIFAIADDGMDAVRIRFGRKFEKELPIGLGAIGSLLAALIVGFVSEITVEAVKHVESAHSEPQG